MLTDLFINMANCGRIEVPEIPEKDKFLDGCIIYEKNSEYDSFYKVSECYISKHWGNIREMTIGTGVLILTWNDPYYLHLYGSLNFEKLEHCINKNFVELSSFRCRDISSLSENDEQTIRSLFNDFLEASKSEIREDKGSPVSVAKALHVLVPTFFPPWDSYIAPAYGEDYYKRKPEEKYINFCKQTKCIYEHIIKYEQIINYAKESNKTLIKLIDEFNYSKYTKGWI